MRRDDGAKSPSVGLYLYNAASMERRPAKKDILEGRPSVKYLVYLVSLDQDCWITYRMLREMVQVYNL